MAEMVITSECERCIHSAIDETDKAKIKVYCNVKDRTYHWGQCIPCDNKDIRKEN